MAEKRLAIMKNVGFGNRDVGEPCLFFDAQFDEGRFALIIINSEEALDIIKMSGVYDVKHLNGRPCWVSIDGNIVEFVGLAFLDSP